MPNPPASGTTALFVRLPADQASRLDRAATVLSARKKDLVAALLERYVDPDSPAGLRELRELRVPTTASPRRVTIDLEEQAMTVGHHSFRPTAVPDVLTAAQAAELLAVDEQALIELAEHHEIPARKIVGQWRFARQALLDWLGAFPQQGQ
jgi:excisionase family DNA binding protein